MHFRSKSVPKYEEHIERESLSSSQSSREDLPLLTKLRDERSRPPGVSIPGYTHTGLSEVLTE